MRLTEPRQTFILEMALAVNGPVPTAR